MALWEAMESSQHEAPTQGFWGCFARPPPPPAVPLPVTSPREGYPLAQFYLKMFRHRGV
jgi:hypothetical protein